MHGEKKRLSQSEKGILHNKADETQMVEKRCTDFKLRKGKRELYDKEMDEGL
jgi:hypothetical protein